MPILIPILGRAPFLNKVKPSEKLKESPRLVFHAGFHISVVEIHVLSMSWIATSLWRGVAPPRLARRGCGRLDSREELLETQGRPRDGFEKKSLGFFQIKTNWGLILNSEKALGFSGKFGLKQETLGT